MSETKSPIYDQVLAEIQQVRPALQRDGGDVELINVTEDGTVQVELQGACKGCPMSQMTLSLGIERYLKENIPEVSRVVQV